MISQNSRVDIVRRVEEMLYDIYVPWTTLQKSMDIPSDRELYHKLAVLDVSVGSPLAHTPPHGSRLPATADPGTCGGDEKVRIPT